MKPLYATYCTDDALYRGHAAALGASAAALGIDVKARLIERSKWARATSYKARFVREMLDLFLDCPIVWLDADARVRQYPALFDAMPGDADVAFHRKDGRELLSGTLWFGQTGGARRLADEWVRECEAHPGVWDQRCLDAALARLPETRVFPLPAPYCLIFDSMAHQGPPVIEHLQASREARKRERLART